MTRSPSLHAPLLASCLLAACSAAPLPTQGVATVELPAPAPTSVASVSAAPGVSASAAPGAEARPAAGRRFVVEERSIPQDIDDDTGPAPCDFTRSYRGKIGQTPVTLLLRAASTATAPRSLAGLAHYDRAGAGMVVSGSLSSDGAFSITERQGGTFAGSCDGAGVLRGSFTLGKSAEPFELHPRPADWPGLYRLRRQARTAPNHPACAKAAKPNELSEIAPDPAEEYVTVICLPTSPAKRKALLEDPEVAFWCQAVDDGYRVFGLAEPAVEQRVNALLAGDSYEQAVKEIRQCTGKRSSFDSMSLVTATKELLVVSRGTSQGFGGVHPMNAGVGSTAVDLRTGRSIKLTELVDTVRLRDLAGACLPIYAQATTGKPAFVLEPAEPVVCGKEEAGGHYLWGCEKDDRAEPLWTLRPEGIVIGSWANPHVSAYADGQGPILSWAVLAREGSLKPNAPIAGLWAPSPAAAPTEPMCSSAFEGSRLRTWREERAAQ